MNCQGSLLVMTLGSELQFEWMLSVPRLDFFLGGNPPVHSKFRQGLGGHEKGPANRFTPYHSKGG